MGIGTGRCHISAVSVRCRRLYTTVRVLHIFCKQLKKKEQEILRDSLDQLIDRQLILDEFTKAGYSLPDSVVNEIIQTQMREQFGDRVTLMKTLKKMGVKGSPTGELVFEDCEVPEENMLGDINTGFTGSGEV